jgi:hypothetical protein
MNGFQASQAAAAAAAVRTRKGYQAPQVAGDAGCRCVCAHPLLLLTNATVAAVADPCQVKRAPQVLVMLVASA